MLFIGLLAALEFFSEVATPAGHLILLDQPQGVRFFALEDVGADQAQFDQVLVRARRRQVILNLGQALLFLGVLEDAVGHR